MDGGRGLGGRDGAIVQVVRWRRRRQWGSLGVVAATVVVTFLLILSKVNGPGTHDYLLSVLGPK